MLFNKKEDCCACGACLNICPKQAIRMELDKYGFIYPVIDIAKCIGCGVCKKVCRYKKLKFDTLPLLVSVAQAERDVLKKSASGGVFASIAQKVIVNGGKVYGVALKYENEKLVAKHIGIDTCDKLSELQGSKYLQSNIGYVYSSIRSELNNNKIILFSGTPCQVAGLRGFLGKKYENLFCIDIICHGVSSNAFFQSYIECLEKKYNDKIIDFKFRDKSAGWGLMANAYTANGKNISIKSEDSSYYEFFLKSYTYRSNCYSCRYANGYRTGDITIGDYWGIWEEHPSLLSTNGGSIQEKLGISCLLINSEHGIALVNRYGNGVKQFMSEFSKVAKHNGQLNHPCKLDNKMRDKILTAYLNDGYDAVERIFEHYTRLQEFKRGVKRMVKGILPKMVLDTIRHTRKQ